MPNIHERGAYERGRVGLLLVKPVNENFSEDGKAYSLYAPEYERLGTIGDLEKLIAGVRRHKDIPVFYSRTAFTDEDYSSWKHVFGIHRQMFDNRLFEADTWNTEFYEDLAPRTGDVILAPHKSLDVLHHTDLEFQLRQRNVEYLAIAGGLRPHGLGVDGPHRGGTRLSRHDVHRRDRRSRWPGHVPGDVARPEHGRAQRGQRRRLPGLARQPGDMTRRRPTADEEPGACGRHE